MNSSLALSRSAQSRRLNKISEILLSTRSKVNRCFYLADRFLNDFNDFLPHTFELRIYRKPGPNYSHDKIFGNAIENTGKPTQNTSTCTNFFDSCVYSAAKKALERLLKRNVIYYDDLFVSQILSTVCDFLNLPFSGAYRPAAIVQSGKFRKTYFGKTLTTVKHT